MGRSETRDFMVGLFVLGGLTALAYLSFNVGGLNYRDGESVPLYATFDQIAGLKPRAPVEISGVKVGQVSGISLDEDYRARVGLEVDAALDLPIDTSASIVTSGLLGDRYISLELGAEEDNLRPGEEISYTESALVLERIIGKFMYNVGSSDD